MKRTEVIAHVFEENQGYLATVARRYSAYLGEFDDLFQELSCEVVAQLKRATGKHSTLQEIRWACKRVVSRLLVEHYQKRVPTVEAPTVSNNRGLHNCDDSDIGKAYDSLPAEAVVPRWCADGYPGLAEALAEGLSIHQISRQLHLPQAVVLAVIRKLRHQYRRDGIRG